MRRGKNKNTDYTAHAHQVGRGGSQEDTDLYLLPSKLQKLIRLGKYSAKFLFIDFKPLEGSSFLT